MLPVYLQIKETLAKDIADGELAPGDIIPSESEMMRRWSVSRITARNVVKELSKDGLVYTVHGRGSFVSQPRITNVLPTLNSYSHDVTAQGMQAGSRVLEFGRIEADREVATRLLVPPQSAMIHFRRVHFANRKAVSISETFLPVSALGAAHGAFTREAVENHSLYGLFQQLGFDLVGGEQEVSATLATLEQAKLLETKRDAALLYADRIAFAPGKIRIEYTRIWTRPDRSRWKIELGPMVPDAEGGARR